MLTQQNYAERRSRLTQEIDQAQEEVNAALAETEGETNPKVHALKHALTALQQQRSDLDAAWKASQPEIERQRAAEDAERRKATLATIEKALADAIRIAAELRTLENRCDTLRAKCRESEPTIRRALASFINLRDVCGRDQLDALPTLVIDGDVTRWAERTRDVAQRILFPSTDGTPSFEVSDIETLEDRSVTVEFGRKEITQ